MKLTYDLWSGNDRSLSERRENLPTFTKKGASNNRFKTWLMTHDREVIFFFFFEENARENLYYISRGVIVSLWKYFLTFHLIKKNYLSKFSDFSQL